MSESHSIQLPSAHARAQRLWSVALRLRQQHIPVLPQLCWWMLRILFSAELPWWSNVPSGLHLHHNASGVVIHPETRFEGDNVLFFHRVTTGNSWGKTEGCPVFGSDIIVGAGVAVLGAVSIGDNVVIGANAVVTKSIPENTLAIGNPATFRSINPGAVKELFKSHLQ